MYPHYKQAVADPMRSYSSLFFRMRLFVLYCSLFDLHHFAAAKDRDEWALPGTEQSHNQQQDTHELAALRNSVTPSKPFKFAIAATPSPNLSQGRDALHRRAMYRNLLTNTPNSPIKAKVPGEGNNGNTSGNRENEGLQDFFGGDTSHRVAEKDWGMSLFSEVRLSQYYCK
jgi:hypothetical protein